MLVKNLTQNTVRDAIDAVSTQYGGNIALENIGQKSKSVVTFKVGALDSRGEGTRHSWMGRHGKWACTHVFEAVMRELVARGGTVAIPKGSKGNETGAQLDIDTDGEVTYWADVYNCANVGSMMQPAYPEELCNHC